MIISKIKTTIRGGLCTVDFDLLNSLLTLKILPFSFPFSCPYLFVPPIFSFFVSRALFFPNFSICGSQLLISLSLSFFLPFPVCLTLTHFPPVSICSLNLSLSFVHSSFALSFPICLTLASCSVFPTQFVFSFSFIHFPSLFYPTGSPFTIISVCLFRSLFSFSVPICSF